MVIYDLVCEFDHSFEGWFKDSDELASQQTSGLLSCPFCNSANIVKKLTAPKVGRKSNSLSTTQNQQTSVAHQELVVGDQPNSELSNEQAKKFAHLQSMLGKVHDYIDANFQDVGNRFAEEAISIHRGDKEPANIKGVASPEQIEEMADEGVQAVALPPKPIDNKKLN